MHLALVNLDTGLFYTKDGWIADFKLAQTFDDREQAAQTAVENKIENAAAARVNGMPPQITGFVWINEPT